MTTVDVSVPVHLVKGDDEVVLRDGARELVHALAEGLDAGLAVEEVGPEQFSPADGDTSIRPLVDAAQTPPFLTDRRVVVGRGVEMFTKADQVAPLVAYLDDPLPTTNLVLVWAGGRIPKSLAEAVKKAGGETVDDEPRPQGGALGRRPGQSVGAQARQGGRGPARRLAGGRPAEARRACSRRSRGPSPPARSSQPATSSRSSAQAGGVPPWELTDAIDKGDMRVALDRLHRMTAGGDRHPLQVMATLHGHYSRMLRLDGARVTGEKDAAALLGLKGSTFPARKALTQTRKLGHDKVVRAIDLLATADLDLRGGKAWPEGLVMEVLVARLTRLAR